MRVGAYDPAVQRCNNCLCWSRLETPRAGKFAGLCRHDPPRVTHKRTLVPTLDAQGKQGMSVLDAETSGWPTTMEEDSCFQHVALLSQ
jgi:hypothetical protein